MEKLNNKKIINIILVGGLVILCFFIVILFNQIKDTHDKNNIHKLPSLKMDSVEKDIKLDDSKLHIYFFWGNTCPHCKALYESLQDVYVKYEGKIFMYGLEVFDNDNNDKLMAKFGEELGISADGVPLMVIGDKYFEGYMEGMEKDIDKEIEKQLKNKNRVDIYKKIVDKGEDLNEEKQ